MTTFDTTTPIRARVRLYAGSARIIASDTDHTVVTVLPSRRDRSNDVDAAERTAVTFADGVLSVTAPRERGLNLVWRPPSVEVLIEVPSGSHIEAETAAGDLEATGRLGECSFKTSAGNVRADDTTIARLRTSAGNVDVRRASVEADLTTKAGNIAVGASEGRATLRASSGDISIGKVNGRVDARTAYGQMRIDAVAEGEVALSTGYGSIDVGVLGGTAAHLDVSSDHGHVRSELTASEEGPEGAERTATIAAVTKYGNVTIRKALA